MGVSLISLSLNIPKYTWTKLSLSRGFAYPQLILATKGAYF